MANGDPLADPNVLGPGYPYTWDQGQSAKRLRSYLDQLAPLARTSPSPGFVPQDPNAPPGLGGGTTIPGAMNAPVSTGPAGIGGGGQPMPQPMDKVNVGSASTLMGAQPGPWRTGYVQWPQPAGGRTAAQVAAQAPVRTAGPGATPAPAPAPAPQQAAAPSAAAMAPVRWPPVAPGTPARPTLANYSDLTSLLESNNQNVLNYKNSRDPKHFTSGGYWQINNTNWNAYAPLLGIDTAVQYPRAIDAPAALQRQVAEYLMTQTPMGISNWTKFNPALKEALRARGMQTEGRISAPLFAPEAGSEQLADTFTPTPLGQPYPNAPDQTGMPLPLQTQPPSPFQEQMQQQTPPASLTAIQSPAAAPPDTGPAQPSPTPPSATPADVTPTQDLSQVAGAANYQAPPQAPQAPPQAPPSQMEQDLATERDLLRQEREAYQKLVPPAYAKGVPGVLQRIGYAVLSATKLAPMANQIMHPTWAGQERAALAQIGGIQAQEQGYQQLSQTEQRMAEAQVAMGQLQLARTKQLIDLNPGARQLAPGQQPASGWGTMPDPTTPGGLIQVPPTTMKSPGLPGYPEGTEVPYPLANQMFTEMAKVFAQPQNQRLTPPEIAQLNTATTQRLRAQGVPEEQIQTYVLPPDATVGMAQRLQTRMQEEATAAATQAQRGFTQELATEAAARQQQEAQSRIAEQKQRMQAQALKDYAPSQDAADLFNNMADVAEKAKAGDQQAGLALLANHLGMTMGAQKGGRLNQALVEEAVRSRGLVEGLLSHISADKGILTGVTLTPGQVDQMLALGQGRFSEAVTRARASARFMGYTDHPQLIAKPETMKFYLKKANMNVGLAKQMAAQDGWDLQ